MGAIVIDPSFLPRRFRRYIGAGKNDGMQNARRISGNRNGRRILCRRDVLRNAHTLDGDYPRPSFFIHALGILADIRRISYLSPRSIGPHFRLEDHCAQRGSWLAVLND